MPPDRPAKTFACEGKQYWQPIVVGGKALPADSRRRLSCSPALQASRKNGIGTFLALRPRASLRRFVSRSTMCYLRRQRRRHLNRQVDAPRGFATDAKARPVQRVSRNSADHPPVLSKISGSFVSPHGQPRMYRPASTELRRIKIGRSVGAQARTPPRLCGECFSATCVARKSGHAVFGDQENSDAAVSPDGVRPTQGALSKGDAHSVKDSSSFGRTGWY